MKNTHGKNEMGTEIIGDSSSEGNYFFKKYYFC